MSAKRLWIHVVLALVWMVAPLVAATVSADERITPRFSGNTALSEEELRDAVAEELAGFADSDYPEVLADDAAFLLESIYRRQGYFFARVAYLLAPDDAASPLSFTIDEGPRVVVAAITIAGNSAHGREELLSFFLEKKGSLFGLGQLPYVESDMEDALAAIRSLYSGEGYQGARIELEEPRFSEDRGTVSLHLRITEGEQSLVGEVRYQGEILPSAADGLDELAARLSGTPYLARRKLMLRSGAAEIYADLGHPEARVQVRENRVDAGRVDLVCSLEAGPEITIAAIRVEGNRRTSRDFIVSRLALAPGQRFSNAAKRESFQRLFASGLFSRVSITLEQGPQPQRRDLVVQVEEAMARELFVHGGWGSYEMLRGGTGFIDRNIFGSGRTLRLELAGSLKTFSWDTSILDPHFLGSDMSADFPVFYHYRQEPSFTTGEVGVSSLLSRKLGRDLTASVGYQFSRTNITSIEAEEVVEPESSYTVARLKLQATMDTRNDILFPTSGRRFFGSFELAEPVLGSGISFYRFNVGGRAFFPLGESTTLAMRYDGGLILPGRNQVLIPIGERYFNGGESSVRGFLESELGPKDASGDPLGGMGFNVLSMELRRLLTDSLALSLFVDYGNLSPNESPEEEDGVAFSDRSTVIRRTLEDFLSDFRPSLGVGINYLLPVGPARLDCAWNPAHRRDEDVYAIHFSIGMAF